MDSKPKPRQRTRKSDGKFKGDQGLNEAWVPTNIEEALPKENDYSVKKLIDGTSKPTAGKYARKPSTRPTFGTVTTTTT